MQKRKKEDRKERDSKIPSSRLLTPIDVSRFGSEDDPCFGTLYDLTTDECLNCGDHELCGISFQNTLKQKRTNWELNNPAQDLEIDGLALQKDVKDKAAQLKAMGYPVKRVHKKLSKVFFIHQDKVKQILNGQQGS